MSPRKKEVTLTQIRCFGLWISNSIDTENKFRILSSGYSDPHSYR